MALCSNASGGCFRMGKSFQDGRAFDSTMSIFRAGLKWNWTMQKGGRERQWVYSSSLTARHTSVTLRHLEAF